MHRINTRLLIIFKNGTLRRLVFTDTLLDVGTIHNCSENTLPPNLSEKMVIILFPQSISNLNKLKKNIKIFHVFSKIYRLLPLHPRVDILMQYFGFITA